MAPITKVSDDPIKLLYIGESGTGKTGSLASLAAEGYNLRIIDVDKGSDILISYLTDPKSPYVQKDAKAAERVDIVRVSDSMQNLNGKLVPKKVEGWPKLTKLLIQWKDGDTDLGPITSWGPKDILVIDSLSGVSRLALNYHLMMNGALGKERTQNEARRDIGNTQNYLRDLLDLIYDDNIRCNVILISHITAVSEAGSTPQIEDGNFKNIPTGFPSAIGRSLSPQIPRWFNNMVVAHKVVQGTKSTHQIFTQSQYISGLNVSAKTAAPMLVKNSYPIDWGMAQLFKDLKGGQ